MRRLLSLFLILLAWTNIPVSATAGSILGTAERSAAKRFATGIAAKTVRPHLTKAVRSSFKDGKYANRQLAEDTLLYRYHRPDNAGLGTHVFLTDEISLFGGQADQRLALPAGKGIPKYVTPYLVPKGTWISEGKVKPANGKRGEGYQAVVEHVEESWARPDVEIINDAKVFVPLGHR